MSRETMRARVDTLVGLLAPDQGESLTDERRRLFAIASAIQADLHATMPADPTPAEGVVVPLEPTPEMVEAGWRAKGGSHEGRPVWKCTVDVQVALIYLAMLAARPAAPTQSAAQTGEVERLRAALERVQYWLRYEVPIGTRSATAMLTVVNNALSQQEPSQ